MDHLVGLPRRSTRSASAARARRRREQAFHQALRGPGPVARRRRPRSSSASGIGSGYRSAGRLRGAAGPGIRTMAESGVVGPGDLERAVGRSRPPRVAEPRGQRARRRARASGSSTSTAGGGPGRADLRASRRPGRAVGAPVGPTRRRPSGPGQARSTQRISRRTALVGHLAGQESAEEVTGRRQVGHHVADLTRAAGAAGPEPSARSRRSVG